MNQTANYRLIMYMFVCLLICNIHVFAGGTKLHIATDKEKYAAAETVQFQIFLLNPSAEINNTVFVELLDCHGNKLAKKMLPFNLNICAGTIDLPANSKAEFYLLYCYVNNGDSMECSLVKKIPVQQNNASALKNPGTKITVNHFFEGGSFVAESPNNILLHCTDENSAPVKVKGKIIDDKNGIYAVFETDKQGFAKVIFNPENKVRYHIIVKDKNANETVSPLPIAATAGITLNVTTTQSSIVYNLLSYSAANSQPTEYHLEALQNDLVVYDAAVSFQPGLSAVKEELKAAVFAPGFVTFRLTDKTNKIYTQRVIYNYSKPAEASFITIIDTVNKKEAKVILPDIISGNSYISIRPADTDASASPDPAFLDIADSVSINDQLIAYPDFMAVSNAENDGSNRYLSLTGTLFNSEKKPLKNKAVNLVIQQKNLKKQFLVTKTDKEGKLKIDNVVFFDTATVYYQLADKSDEKNDVFMDLFVNPDKASENRKNGLENFTCDAVLSHTDSTKFLKPDEKTLSQVTVTAEKEKTESEKYTDKYVSGQMKKSSALRNEFDFIKNPESIDNKSLFLFLQTRISSIRIFTTAFGGLQISGTNGGTVGVYLNDMELPPNESMDIIKDLLVKDVAMVRFYSMSFKPKLIGGNPLTDSKASDAGDLMIYTKRDYNASDKTKGLPKTTVVGYDLTGTPSNLVSVQGNNESLFWKPDWKVTGGQVIYIALPPGETGKKHEIVLEGINTFQAPYHFKQNLVFN